MGKKRKVRQDLPQKVYFKHGAYYFVTHKKKWIRLSSNFPKAMALWAKLVDCEKKMVFMKDVMDRYMKEISPLKAPGTYKNNLAEMVNLKKAFGDMYPDKIEPPHIYQYLDIRGKSAPVSANREIALLSHAFKMAIKWGVLRANPCVDVERNKENKRDKYLTDEEFKTIMSVATPLIGCIMEVAYITGLRKKDILLIRLADISEAGLIVKPSKTKNSTKKKLIFENTPELKSVIARAKSINRSIGGLFLFNNRKGQPYTTMGFDTMWKRVLLKSGLKGIQFRDIRSKAITDAKRAGMDAQQFAGHANSAMTDHYVKIREQDRIVPLKKIE